MDSSDSMNRRYSASASFAESTKTGDSPFHRCFSKRSIKWDPQ